MARVFDIAPACGGSRPSRLPTGSIKNVDPSAPPRGQGWSTPTSSKRRVSAEPPRRCSLRPRAEGGSRKTEALWQALFRSNSTSTSTTERAATAGSGSCVAGVRAGFAATSSRAAAKAGASRTAPEIPARAFHATALRHGCAIPTSAPPGRAPCQRAIPMGQSWSLTHPWRRSSQAALMIRDRRRSSGLSTY